MGSLAKYVMICFLLFVSWVRAEVPKSVELYHYADFAVELPGVSRGQSKWDVEAACTWTHEDGVTKRTSLLWYSGKGDTYFFRFGASLPGKWTGKANSEISLLKEKSFSVVVEKARNPNRIGWSGQMKEKPNAWAHQKGEEGKLAQRTPILIMMPDVKDWAGNPQFIKDFIEEFNEGHGFNGGHVSTVGSSWFKADSHEELSGDDLVPDPRTFAAIELAAMEWAERGGWLHIWMWGKGKTADFSLLAGGYDGAVSKRLNRYLAARLAPVPGWSMGLGWDVEFWADEEKIKWWMDDLATKLGGWHHWLGFRYSDSDIGQGHDPEPANQGLYGARGIKWNTLRPGREQYAGWEHWCTTTTDAEIDQFVRAFPDRPLMSEDRFRQRTGAWKQKDLRSDEDVLKEIPRWASRGVGAIYGRLLEKGTKGSERWPNKAEIKRTIREIEEGVTTLKQ